MENLNKQIQELQKIIDTYGNIVFFEAWTDCITNSTITRQRRF